MILSGRRRPYSGPELGLRQAAWAHRRGRLLRIHQEDGGTPGFAPCTSAVSGARRTIHSVRRTNRRPPHGPDANRRPRQGRYTRAVIDLTQRIHQIEARISELKEHKAKLAVTGHLTDGADLELGKLAARLAILRRQNALLTEGTAAAPGPPPSMPPRADPSPISAPTERSLRPLSCHGGYGCCDARTRQAEQPEASPTFLAARSSWPSRPRQGQAARGRFASPGMAATDRGVAGIEEDGGGPGHGHQRARAAVRRAISGPLTPVKSGLSRSLADIPLRRSGHVTSPDRTDSQADSAGSIPVTRSKAKMQVKAVLLSRHLAASEPQSVIRASRRVSRPRRRHRRLGRGRPGRESRSPPRSAGQRPPI